ncbi:hypothetical protein HRbin09_00189 [bacterium HR09]|nr:hypothetical protein HRbin09_00189 [bacterium HR09]
MGRRYVNPPVVEAVCEFRLTEDSPWDMTVPGLVYERLKDEFPHREQRLSQEVELTQGPDGLQQQIRTSERILLFAENRTSFVQVAPRLLAVNSLRPYPSWEGFKPRITKAFESLAQVTEVRGLDRLGLRFINHVEIPGSPRELDKYFQFYPFLGPDLPNDIEGFIAGCQFGFENRRDICKVQLIRAISSSPERLVIFLDIDYFLAKPGGVDPRYALDWVEEAHSKVEAVFEGCITDRLRELFGEVK